MRPQYLILAEASVTESTVSAMDTMMTVLYLGCGFYCLLLWFRLRRGAPISAGKSILIPGGWQDKKCRHPQEYKQAIMPRVLILGAGLTLFGLLLTADHFLHGGDGAAPGAAGLVCRLHAQSGAEMVVKAIRPLHSSPKRRY